MQRVVIVLGSIVVLTALLLAVVAPDLSVMVILAACMLGVATALFIAITQTIQWISGRLAR